MVAAAAFAMVACLAVGCARPGAAQEGDGKDAAAATTDGTATTPREAKEGASRAAEPGSAKDTTPSAGETKDATPAAKDMHEVKDGPAPPPQPIQYSHLPHVTGAEMPCTRCHYGAADSVRAGLPPMSFCVGCHKRRIPDHPEIVKLMQYYEKGQAIQWRKVNVMPRSAMIHFDHGAHARAKIECQTCHGDVGHMKLARRVIDTANMGWCVDCHRERNAPTDCVTCHH